jgi:hypothetical protein
VHQVVPGWRARRVQDFSAAWMVVSELGERVKVADLASGNLPVKDDRA